MADSFFQVSAKWEGSLEQEVDQFMPQIKNAAHRGLEISASNMTLSLLDHIKWDMYYKWGDPLVYKRRKDFTKYGTSMLSSDNIHPDVKGLSLNFLYTPNAKHAAKNWSSGLSSDDLIEIIQTNEGWSYEPSKDKNGREIMPRPFWNNFVEEQRNGALMDSFAKGFIGSGFDLVLEGGILDLDFPASESMLEGGIDDGANGQSGFTDDLSDF